MATTAALCPRCHRHFTGPEGDMPEFCCDCAQLTIDTTSKVLARLETLLKSGLYGLTIEETAERVLVRGLEALLFRRRP